MGRVFSRGVGENSTKKVEKRRVRQKKSRTFIEKGIIKDQEGKLIEEEERAFQGKPQQEEISRKGEILRKNGGP